jgi:hypothetical protein
MGETMYGIFTLFAALFALNGNAAPTHLQCSQAYDKCKKDVEHLFDKRPCKRALVKCHEAATLTDNKEAARQRILGRQQRPGDDMRHPGAKMRNPGGMRELTAREAAEQRLRERQSGADSRFDSRFDNRFDNRFDGTSAAQPPVHSGSGSTAAGDSGMRARVQEDQNQKLDQKPDPKAEAQRRLNMRQQATDQPSPGSMRKKVHSN